jgi:hypothetical protein
MKWLVPIAVGLAVAGCGGTTIDGGELEDEIREDTEREGLIIDGADCPSPDAEEGNSFECIVTVKGEDKQLEIEQRNDDGNVSYDLGPLLEGTSGSDAGGDVASVRSVIDVVNKDVTALCDYATPEFRKELAGQENCAKAVLADHESPLLEDYGVSIDGDHAAASEGDSTVTLERQRNGSWLITDVR